MAQDARYGTWFLLNLIFDQAHRKFFRLGRRGEPLHLVLFGIKDFHDDSFARHYFGIASDSTFRAGQDDGVSGTGFLRMLAWRVDFHFLKVKSILVGACGVSLGAGVETWLAGRNGRRFQCCNGNVSWSRVMVGAADNISILSNPGPPNTTSAAGGRDLSMLDRDCMDCSTSGN